MLNTDNRLMSGTTLTDEYVHAAEHLDFSFDEAVHDRAERLREARSCHPAESVTRLAATARDEITAALRRRNDGERSAPTAA